MKLKIFHMASMARSGETLVQRHLQAHPKVLVTHNLKKKDERNEALLFNYIKRSPHLSISGSSKRLRDYETSGKEVLLVKQGVWEHPFPFRGFILARNPLAIFASLWTYDSMEKGGSPEGNWKYNEERLLRWLGDIDPKLIPGFIDLDPEHQFSTFYNRRMCILLESQLPIIYYEKLVRAPEQEFRRLCSILGIHFDEQVLAAHCRYGPADIGHGQTEMARPIDTKSLDKYRRVLTPDQIKNISVLTKQVSEKFGYLFHDGQVSLIERECLNSKLSKNATSRPISFYMNKLKKRVGL